MPASERAAAHSTPPAKAAPSVPSEFAEDSAVVERVLRGDAAAFGDLVRRYACRAFAVASRVLGHREDAEDLVQEAFLTALGRLHTFDTGRAFGPWFLRIVANRALNARKARALRRADAVPIGVSAPGPSPEGDVERAEVRERLARAFAALPDRQRLVVRLFEVEGLSSAEVATALGLPAGTVRWHLHQARAALRLALAPLREAAE